MILLAALPLLFIIIFIGNLAIKINAALAKIGLFVVAAVVIFAVGGASFLSKPRKHVEAQEETDSETPSENNNEVSDTAVATEAPKVANVSDYESNTPPTPSVHTGTSVAADDSSKLSVELAMAVQRVLRGKGYYRGAVDGEIGDGTRAAIREYQYDHQLEITGRVDRNLLDSLTREVSGPAPASIVTRHGNHGG